MMQRLFLFITVFCCMSFCAYAEDSHKIYTLPSEYIVQHIEQTTGQKRVLMIYASWCPYCRKKMPAIMDLERVQPGSIIAVSVDENHIDFARYIKKLRDVPFKLILNKDSEAFLAKQLKKNFSIQPWDSIPQFVFLDEDNKVVEQGSYSPDQVAAFLLNK